MIASIQAVVTLLNGLWTLFTNLFGGKSKTTDTTQDAASDAVQQSNLAGKIAADATRETEQQNETAESRINADIDRTRRNFIGAGSVRDQQAAIADAIDRANKDAGSNG